MRSVRLRIKPLGSKGGFQTNMATRFCLLAHLGLSPCVVEEQLEQVGVSAPEVWQGTQNTSSSSLRKWLSLLPREVLAHLDLALRQQLPFMPPTFIPELLSSPNERLPSMNQIQIICHCIDLAMNEEDYYTASSLIFLVDRACYRFGYSRPLLRVADEIMSKSPGTPVAPQVVLRKARVMKDTGDLNGATRILNKIISKEHKWTYQSKEQVDDTKAACWHVEGQVYHNVGLWRKAVTPLVEALNLFRNVGDDKGIASCLDVLSRCLSHLSFQEYEDVRRCHKDIFRSEHPYYEAYQQAMEAVNCVQHITAGFFSSKHQLVADESLLKYASLQTLREQHKLLEKILQEMRIILAGYQHLTFMRSVESFFGFVRTLFTVSLVLDRSTRPEDKEAARVLEKISMDLFQFMCRETSSQDPSGETLNELKQTWESVRHINIALTFLRLPLLEETEGTETRQPEEQGASGVVVSGQDEQEKGEHRSVRIDEELMTEMQGDHLLESDEVQSSSVKYSQSTQAPSSPVQSGPKSSPVKSSPVESCPVQSSPVKYSQSAPATSSPVQSGPKSSPVESCPVQSSPGGSSQVQGDDGARQGIADSFNGSDCHRISKRHNVSKTLDASSFSDIRAEFLAACDRPAAGAATFPAAAGGNNRSPENRGAKDDRTAALQPFVGLPISRQELLCSAYPALTPEGAKSLEADDSEDGSICMDKCDEQSLSVSMKTFSSASSGESPCEDFSQLADLSSFLNISSSSKCAAAVHHDVSHTFEEKDSPKLDCPATEVCQSQRTGIICDKILEASEDTSLPIGSTVNLDATTKASSYSWSSDADGAVDEGDGEVMESLMDLSESSVNEVLKALTRSLEKSDCLNEPDTWTTWIPQADRKVHRAVLMTFNPETGDWWAQTTMVYLGLELQTERKGAFRDAFFVSFIHQDEPLGRYVGKRYRVRQRTPRTYMLDVVCQMVSACLVNIFNQALTNCPHDFLRVQFLPVYHLQMYSSHAVCDWFNLEPFLHGSFVKLTNNHRYVSSDSEVRRGTIVGTAFTHFSFVRAHGLLMVVDLQGWVPTDDRGMIYLTDPVWHTRFRNPFSSCDRREEGMAEFWKDVHPQCNEICQFLGIDRLRPTD